MEFKKIGVPSGCHGQAQIGLEMIKKEKVKWIDEKGFITGIR
jgi:hypothetical protein